MRYLTKLFLKIIKCQQHCQQSNPKKSMFFLMKFEQKSKKVYKSPETVPKTEIVKQNTEGKKRECK